MRRKDREVTDPAAIMEIIDACEILRLGLSDGEYPYIVPVNFAYTEEEGQICFYIHGAMAGRKYRLLRAHPVCSFEMDIPLKMDLLYDHHDITMRYQSVMGKASAEFLEGDARKEAVENIILKRHESTADFPYNQAALQRTAVVRLTVTELTCKVNPLQSGPDL